MGSKFSFAYRTTKRRPTRALPPFRAAMMFNDGGHLYVKGTNGVLRHLPFRLVCRDVSCRCVPEFAFPESDILIKSFGHTLNKNVIVLLRSSTDNWSLNLSIGAGITSTVYDFGSYMYAVLEK